MKFYGLGENDWHQNKTNAKCDKTLTTMPTTLAQHTWAHLHDNYSIFTYSLQYESDIISFSTHMIH